MDKKYGYMDFTIHKHGPDFSTCNFGSRQIFLGKNDLLGRKYLLFGKGYAYKGSVIKLE